MNGWHQGDPVHMDSTNESLCNSHTSCLFFPSASVGNAPAMSQGLSQQCHSLWWKHRPVHSCGLVGKNVGKNRSEFHQMLRAITLHGLRGKWKHWELFGVWPSDFKHKHFNTTCRLSCEFEWSQWHHHQGWAFFPHGYYTQLTSNTSK